MNMDLDVIKFLIYIFSLAFTAGGLVTYIKNSLEVMKTDLDYHINVECKDMQKQIDANTEGRHDNNIKFAQIMVELKSLQAGQERIEKSIQKK